MQRTSGLYQPSLCREESFSIPQAHNISISGTVSQQLHWKKRILNNKAGSNKRRQNPARQAAVRNFKKYHFSNQDFLLRKYLRSIKKDIRPKQVVVNTSSVSEGCSNSQQLVDNNCVRQHGTSNNDTRNKISNLSFNNSSSLINKKNNTNSFQDNVEVITTVKHQSINLDDEMKMCTRRNWTAYGVERPTFETVVQELSPTICCNELKEIIKDSTDFVKLYCESLKQLTGIINCCNDEYIETTDRISISCNNRNNFHINNKNNNNKKKDINQLGNNDLRVNIYSKSDCFMGRLGDKKEKDYKQGSNHDDDDDDDDDEDDDEDEDEDEDEDDDDIDDEEDDEDDDEDDEDEDEDDDDDEDDIGECEKMDEDNDHIKNSAESDDYNNSSDDCSSYPCNLKISDKRIPVISKDKIFVKRDISDGSINNNIINNKDNNGSNCISKNNHDNNQVQDEVDSIDTSDSSSDSSSQDNSSVSTETCCSDSQNATINESEDNSVVNSDTYDHTLKTNINENLVHNDEFQVRSEQTTNINNGTDQSPHFIKIKDKGYLTSVTENDIKTKSNIHIIRTENKQKIFDSLRKSNEVENVILNENGKTISNDDLHNQNIKGVDKINTVRYNELLSRSRQISKENPTTTTTSRLSKPQGQIMLKNRVYPASVIDNNPELLNHMEDVYIHEKFIPSDGRKDKRKQDVKKFSHPIKDKKQEDLRVMKTNTVSGKPQGRILINNKVHSASIIDNNPALLNYVEDVYINEQILPSDNLRKDKRKQDIKKCTNVVKENKSETNEVLSTVCSIEDGLAFLDNQNELPTTPNIQHHRLSDPGETITLYNHFTSCTLPYPVTTVNHVSQNVSSSVTSKSNKSEQNSLKDLSSSSICVASQTTSLSPMKKNRSIVFLPNENTQANCSQCKEADTSLAISLQNSLNHLNDLLMSTVVLNSLLTGQCQIDITEKMTYNRSNDEYK